MIFFFKQKTAYEMRISDWSSDVCSSDLAHPDTHSNPQVRADLVLALARGAGAHGMVGGQMIDLQAETQQLDIGQITRLQQPTTGALIAFACEAGAIMDSATAPAPEAPHGYAHHHGLAFQTDTPPTPHDR